MELMTQTLWYVLLIKFTGIYPVDIRIEPTIDDASLINLNVELKATPSDFFFSCARNE